MQVSTNPDKYDVGKRSLSIKKLGKQQADVNSDGSVNNKDALIIQKYKLRLITELPYRED